MMAGGLGETAPELADVEGPDRGFTRFWTGSTISAAGSALTTVAIPVIAVQSLDATPAQMGVLFAAATGASLLVRLPAAAAADRSAWPLAIVARAQITSGALIAALPLLWWLGFLNFQSLLLVMAGVGATAAIGEAFAGPSVPLLVSAGRLAPAFGRFTASRSAADVAGPAVGGVLLQVLAAPLLLVFDAVSFVMAGLLTSSVRMRRHAPQEEDGADGPPVSDLWAVMRVPFLRRSLTLVLLASLANGAVSALLVLYMVRDLGLEAWAVGLVLGVGAIGGIVAGLSIGAIQSRLGVYVTAAVAALLMLISFAGLPLARPGVGGLIACFFYELVGSFGAALMVITIVSEIPTRLPRSATARAMAVANLVPEVAATVGALAGGLLASGTSVRATLLASFLFAAGAGGLSLIAMYGRARLSASKGGHE